MHIPIQTLFNAIQQPDNWDRAMDEICDYFGITCACIYAVNTFDNVAAGFRLSKLARENFAPQYEALLDGRDTSDQHAHEMMLRRRPMELISETQLFGVAERSQLPANPMRQGGEAVGMYLRYAATLNKSGPWLDGFFAQSFSEREAQQIAASPELPLFLPLLSQALGLGRVFGELRNRHRAALAALDKLGLGVFLVDYRGFVLSQNAEATRILARQDGLSLSKNKQLSCRDGDTTSELNFLIQRANGLFHGDVQDNKHNLISIQRPSGDFPFLVSVRSVLDHEAELEADLSCAFVTVIDPARENQLSAETLAALGGLTNGEKETVEHLIQGLRPADIAERRDLSLNTIKTQLKTASQKLRCHSQADIIRVAATTRLPIED